MTGSGAGTGDGTPEVITGEGLVLRVPVRGYRQRWLELLHDPDKLRYGMPAFVPVPETFDELDKRVTEAVVRFEP